ncbi:MAG: fructosamine kinase family protein, partial [Pseudomonadales bacterium]|nr:fructosamine kinase family protein [Pseudomonadales bacterium]
MSHTLESWLKSEGLGDIRARESLSGGCISEVSRLQLSTGSTAILKQHPLPPPGIFAAEAAGLNALHESQTLRVPQVLFCSDHFILLEDLGQSNKPGDFWNRLGTGLAALHAQTNTEFGFSLDNYCGAMPQSNTHTKDGYQF